MMRKIRQIFITTLFICCFSFFATAQDIPNYLFLEVIDSNEKPIEDATIDLPNPVLEQLQKLFVNKQKRQTDKYGKAAFMLPHISSNFSESIFNVSKFGYFDFFDFGVLIRPRDQTGVRIELLKIPETKEEEKALGNEQIKREFIWAAKNGDSIKVGKFLKAGISPNLNTNDLRGVSEPKNISAVLFAAASGDSTTVKILLEAGANVRTDVEPLHSILAHYLIANPVLRQNFQSKAERKKAIEKYQKGIKSLIKAGAAADDLLLLEGQTALMIAAGLNDAESVKLLIKPGIPVNAEISGYTALMSAVNMYGSNRAGFSPIEVVEILLKAGADPNIAVNPLAESNCSSILMKAVWGGDLKVAKLLIDYKADVNFTCKNGDSALQFARRYSVIGQKNQLEMIQLLEAAGAK